eukprot:1158455-Pelagomonas_calceolata.AAC.3
MLSFAHESQSTPTAKHQLKQTEACTHSTACPIAHWYCQSMLLLAAGCRQGPAFSLVLGADKGLRPQSCSPFPSRSHSESALLHALLDCRVQIRACAPNHAPPFPLALNQSLPSFMLSLTAGVQIRACAPNHAPPFRSHSGSALLLALIDCRVPTGACPRSCSVRHALHALPSRSPLRSALIRAFIDCRVLTRACPPAWPATAWACMRHRRVAMPQQ